LNRVSAAAQDITGDRAEELMQLCALSEQEAKDGHTPLFRINGSGSARELEVVKTRGNEHHLEKVRTCPCHIRAASHMCDCVLGLLRCQRRNSRKLI
jgi:hypothetical protein